VTFWIVALSLVGFVGHAQADAGEARWMQGPHAEFLRRILPPRMTPQELPEPASPCARLVATYCSQCHHLPNPAMHAAERWSRVVDRTIPRMQGKGNMGRLMGELMAGVRVPDQEEIAVIKVYLARHAQSAWDSRNPAVADVLRSERGMQFAIACTQCHALPDPRRHTARQWPGVVARMQDNLLWMNRVVLSRPDPAEPQLDAGEITAFLKANARK
jgi:hypothetical protein